GVREIWRLVWEAPPKPACAAGTADWYTCPCIGFAFGERGRLDLVRLRGGHEVERMSLAPLFDEDETDAPGEVTLRRVEPSESDHDGDLEDEDLPGLVAHRPSDRILELADYDHDGRATEFLLQVEAE